MDEPDADRLARLRAGLPDERLLLESLGDVLRDLKAAAAEEEALLDLDAGWDRVKHLLGEEPPAG